ncbi:MAG: NAD(P)H-dependent oxidoreductase [Candidatus Gracilibacteria bacterium]|nr:NAD(P)H-dependent oxidoreductase [Candidatus Gracilibacteria bacterium]
MTKILAIMASPEIGGNTDTILDNTLKKLPKNSYEKVILKNINIEYYSHEYKRPKKEETEFLELVEKIKKADILLIATPTYNFGVPAKLKNLIDRIGYISLDYKKINRFGQPTGILNKKTYFLVTGGANNFVQKFIFFLYPILWLKAIFTYYGGKNIGKIYIGGLDYTHHIKNPENKSRLNKITDKISDKLKKYL